MGGAFSQPMKKAPKKAAGGTISSIDRAVLDLKNSRDRLSRYKKKTTEDCNKLLSRAQAIRKENSQDQQKLTQDQQKTITLNLLKLRKVCCTRHLLYYFQLIPHLIMQFLLRDSLN